ncbi:hypothetical protein ACI65C_000608 [Semiaphis heraclei]
MKSLMVLLVLSSATVRLGHALTWSEVGDWIVGAADTINPVKVVQRTIDDDFKTAGSVLVHVIAFPLGLGAVIPIIDPTNPLSKHFVNYTAVGEWIVGAADTVNPVKVVQRTIDDNFQTVGKFALNVGESVPVVGHGIYVVQLARGDVEAANRALASANSGAAAVAGGALGTLCGPAAMVCVPVFTVAAQTGMDAVNTVVFDKQSGNIEYFANFRNKSGWEHAAFAGAFVLDAVTAGKGGKIVFKPSKNVKNIDDVGKSISKNINEVHVPEMTKYVDADKNVPSKTVNHVNDEKFGNYAESTAGTAGSSPESRHIKPTDDGILHTSFDTAYKKTIDDVQLKFTDLHVKRNLPEDYIDYYSEIDLYNGPIIEFQPRPIQKNGKDVFVTNEYAQKIDQAARDMIIDPTINPGMKNALELRALYIKTDPRASKFPELNNFPDKMLYNVKLDDLIDYNVGQSFDEVSSNCIRLSISKVFNVDYNDMKKKFLSTDKQLHPKAPENYKRYGYERNMRQSKEILDAYNLKFDHRQIPDDMDPTSILKTAMKEKQLKEIHAIVTVKQTTSGFSHAMTIRATANGDDKILDMIVDHQVNVGYRVKPKGEDIFTDFIRFGKRFMQLSELKKYNIVVKSFIFNV